jgi:hypothetical protein
MKIEKIDKKYVRRFSKDELRGFIEQAPGEYASGSKYRGRFTDDELKGFILRYAGLQWVLPGFEAERFISNASFGEAGYAFPDAEGNPYFVGVSVAPGEWGRFRKELGGNPEAFSKFDWNRFDSYITSTYGSGLTAMIIERVKADIREEIAELADGPGTPGGVPYETFRDKALSDIETAHTQPGASGLPGIVQDGAADPRGTAAPVPGQSKGLVGDAEM